MQIALESELRSRFLQPMQSDDVEFIKTKRSASPQGAPIQVAGGTGKPKTQNQQGGDPPEPELELDQPNVPEMEPHTGASGEGGSGHGHGDDGNPPQHTDPCRGKTNGGHGA